MEKTLIYRVSFDVYGIPENDPDNALNNLIDELGAIETSLSWDNVWWQPIGEEVTE